MWSALLVTVLVPALIAIAVSFVPVPPVPTRDPTTDRRPDRQHASAATPASVRRFTRCAPARTGDLDVSALRPDAPA